MSDRQKKAVIYIGLFGLCFLFIWFSSLLYTGDDKGTNDTNSGAEVYIKKDSVSNK